MNNIKKSIIKLLMSLFALLVGSCSFLSTTDIIHTKSDNYFINSNILLSNHWSETEGGSSDYAFINKENQSFIIVNSICDRYRETSLFYLSQNLLSDIDNPVIISREKKDIKDQPSILLNAHGSFEGHTIELTGLTLRHSTCIYDFILISHKHDSKRSKEKNLDDFWSYIDTLQFNEKRE